MKNPEKDLHSVYIDGEMPQEFIGEYEGLVRNSPESAAELEKMKRISELLREDSKSHSVDSIFAQQSFERLETKLKYKKVVSTIAPVSFSIDKNSIDKKKSYANFIKLPVSFAAAAAVFAVIFTPSYLKTVRQGAAAELVAISRTNDEEITPISQNDVVIDGNIPQETLSTVFASAQSQTVQESEFSGALAKSTEKDVSENSEKKADAAISSAVQKTVRATSTASTSNRPNFNSPDIDVFRPEFRENPIRMRIPEIHELHKFQQEKTESQSAVDAYDAYDAYIENQEQ